jgi:uncharacterized protein with WD repeat
MSTKKIILLCLLMAGAMASKAQLTNTKWSGKMNIPDEMQVTLHFTTDTLYMLIADMGNQPGEVMSYSAKDSTITLRKISGNSPCDTAAFTVRYTVKNNQLFLTDIADPCAVRVDAWTKDPFVKQ